MAGILDRERYGTPVKYWRAALKHFLWSPAYLHVRLLTYSKINLKQTIFESVIKQSGHKKIFDQYLHPRKRQAALSQRSAGDKVTAHCLYRQWSILSRSGLCLSVKHRLIILHHGHEQRARETSTIIPVLQRGNWKQCWETPLSLSITQKQEYCLHQST